MSRFPHKFIVSATWTNTVNRPESHKWMAIDIRLWRSAGDKINKSIFIFSTTVTESKCKFKSTFFVVVSHSTRATDAAQILYVCVLCSVLTKCIYLLYSIFVDAFIVVLAVHHRAVSCSDRLQNDVPPLFADVIAKCPYSIHSSSSSSTNMQRIMHAEYSPANWKWWGVLRAIQQQQHRPHRVCRFAPMRPLCR